MKNAKLFFTVAVILILTVTLMGCGSKQVSKGKDESEGNEAKKEIEKLVNRIDTRVSKNIEEIGYVEYDKYFSFKAEVNQIAGSMAIDERITMNDTEMFNTALKAMKRKANSLTNKEAVKIQKRLNSSKILFKNVFMEEFHESLEFIDVKGEYGYIKRFLLRNSNVSEKEIMEDAAKTIRGIKGGMESLNTMEVYIEKYGNTFTLDELDLLHGIVNHFKSSLKTQIEIMEFFTETNTKVENPFEEKVEVAKMQFVKGKNALFDLEKSLGVQYN